MLSISDDILVIISPDGTKVAFYAGAAIYVYNMNNWSRLCELTGEKIVTALWADPWNLYVGGEKSIRRWNVVSDTFDVIALSSVASAYWTADGSTIIADNNSGNSFELMKEFNIVSGQNLNEKI